MKLSIRTTKVENIFGWLLLAGHLLILPSLAISINEMFANPLSEASLNLVLFLAELALTILIFRKFLWASTKAFARKPFLCVGLSLLGFAMYYIGTAAVGLLIQRVSENFSNVNNDSILELIAEKPALKYTIAFAVPITEELIYRAMVFRSLQVKSRLAAYLISITVFSLIHVLGYIGTASPLVLLLCFLQYIPASFSLAWIYEKADTIWAPILMHMSVNLTYVLLMR